MLVILNPSYLDGITHSQSSFSSIKPVTTPTSSLLLFVETVIFKLLDSSERTVPTTGELSSQLEKQNSKQAIEKRIKSFFHGFVYKVNVF